MRSRLRTVFDGLVVRVLAGAVMACRSLDDDAAAAMVERLAGVQAALALVDHPARRGRVAGGADAGRRTQRRARVGAGPRHAAAARRRHVEPGAGRGTGCRGRCRSGRTPAVGAAFVEGFLAGSGTVLVHDRELLDVIDGWVSSLAPDAFVATVPLLRRTFGAFEPAERRQLGLLLADQAAPTCVGLRQRRRRRNAPPPRWSRCGSCWGCRAMSGSDERVR